MAIKVGPYSNIVITMLTFDATSSLIAAHYKVLLNSNPLSARCMSPEGMYMGALSLIFKLIGLKTPSSLVEQPQADKLVEKIS